MMSSPIPIFNCFLERYRDSFKNFDTCRLIFVTAPISHFRLVVNVFMMDGRTRVIL